MHTNICASAVSTPLTCEIVTENLDIILTPRGSSSFGPEGGANEVERMKQKTIMTAAAAETVERMAEQEALAAAAAAEATRLSALTVTAEEEQAARALSLLVTDKEKEKEKHTMLVENNKSRISHINEAMRQAREDLYMNKLRTFKKSLPNFEKFLLTPTTMLDNDTPVEAAHDAFYHSAPLDKMLKAMAINPKRLRLVLQSRSVPLLPPHSILISTCICCPFLACCIRPTQCATLAI